MARSPLMHRRLSKAVTLLPLITVGAFSLLSSISYATPNIDGVLLTVYDNLGYNNAPPLPSSNQIVGTVVEPRVEHYFEFDG